MNFCYIFTILCGIFIISLIFINSIEAYVARLHSQKISTQKLNELRLEALKPKEDFQKLSNKFHENDNHGKRKRRQTIEDTLHNIPQNMDQEKENLEPLAADQDADFSQAYRLPEQIKQSLRTTNQINNFLNSLNQESSKKSREISLIENEPNMIETPEENNENSVANREELGLSKSAKSFKEKDSDKKEKSKIRNHKDYQNLNQKLNLYKGLLKDDELISSKQTASCSNSDLSSCQHCSQHVEAGALMNRYDKNDLKSNNNPKFEIDSKTKDVTNSFVNNKKFQGKQNAAQTFDSKFPLKSPANDNDDDDEEDEEEDLYQLNNPATVLKTPKQKTENRNVLYHNDYKLSSPSKNSENFNLTKISSSRKFSQPLNDQLDNTKNNLSHEANYKLSKTEQDASEKKKDFSWKWGIFKRSHQFNAMNEIKLKTSSRLMKKGFGASLPSYSLGETRKELMIANMLRKKEKQLMQEKYGKYYLENVDELKDTFGGDDGVMQTYKQLDDFVNEPLESAAGSMGQNYRRYIRKKRISDENKRFKRETREYSTKELNEIREKLKNFKELNAEDEDPKDYQISQSLKLDSIIKKLRNESKSETATKNSSKKCPAFNLKAYMDTNRSFFVDKAKGEIIRKTHDNSLNKSIKESLKKSFNPKIRLKRANETNMRELNKKVLPIETKKFDKSLKRLKRSIKSNSQDNGLKSDVNKNFNKRKYSHFDDLYKPQYNFDYANTKQMKSNLDNDFTNSRQIFNNDELEKNGNFDFTFDRDGNENLKDKDLLKQKFDNLWQENNSHKYEKRLIKSKNLRKHVKKPPVKRQNLFGNKTNINDLTIQQLKSDDFPLKVQLLKDKYLSDLQNFNQNYKFNENHFTWPQPNLKNYNDLDQNSTEMLTTTEDSHKLSLELRNEILNCKAFASLEDFLKSLPQNITNSLLQPKTEPNLYSPSTEKIEMDINTAIITEITTTLSPPTVLDSTVICSSTEELETTTESTEDITQPTEVDYEEITECISEENLDETSTDSVLESETEDVSKPTTCADDVKLNISINANVQGNLKSNHFCGNGSFNVIPGLKDHDDADDRRRRRVFSAPLESYQKRKCAEIPTQKPYDSEDNQDMNDLMSGKLSTNVVKTILKTVRESPELKALWPSLKRNQPQGKSTESNFYAIRNTQNDNELQNSEKLLAQVMSSINTIIEAQARSKACMPLRPDLQEFYNMILETRREQDMVREKRHPKHFHKREDFSYKTHLIDPQKIEEEMKIVKNLLKQENQKAVKEDLLQNLAILQEMQDITERQKRKQRESEKHVKDGDPIKSLRSHYSAQFLKLVKAAEFYRDISRE